MKKNNKKSNVNNDKNGFTLIELLAVIIILAILLMTALPAVTRAIDRSRKNAYATNAKKFIDAVRTDLIDGDLFITKDGSVSQGGVGSVCQTPAPNTYVAVPIQSIYLERGKDQSSFSKAYTGGYVIVANKTVVSGGRTTQQFEYYFIGVDAGNNGVDDYILEANLTRGVVKSGDANPGTKISAVASLPTLSLSGVNYQSNAVCEEG